MTRCHHLMHNRRSVVFVVLGLVSFFCLQDVVAGHEVARQKRDGYGGGYGGLSYGGGSSSYGCSCSPVQCDTKTDAILAFGIGALAGLLLAMLRGGMMMMMAAAASAAIPPPAMGRAGVIKNNNVTWNNNDENEEDHRDSETLLPTWRSFHVQQQEQHRRSSLVRWLHLPDNLGDHLAPVVGDMLDVYSKGSKTPECLRRWVCELARHLQDNGGVQAHIGSLSSIAFGWYTKDPVPILNNILDGGQSVDCKLLSPKCDKSFPLTS